MEATAQAPTDTGSGVHDLMTAGLEYAAAAVSRTIEQWTDKLDELATGGGGAVEGAVAAGAQATAQGKNPIWAALKGAWSGASAKTRLLVLLILVGLLLASVLLLVVALLALLITALVEAIRAVTG